MKNKALILPTILLALIVGTAACKKCYTCKVKDAVGNTIFYAEEKCGTKDEIATYENDLLETYYCKTFTVKDSDGAIIYVTKQVCGQDALMDSINLELYWTFIADSPTVTSTQVETKVYCVK